MPKINIKDWDNLIEKKVNDFFLIQDNNEIEKLSSLKWYRGNLGYKKRQPYLNGSKESEMFFKIKSSILLQKKFNNAYILCDVCGVMNTEEHLILNCPKGSYARYESGLCDFISSLRSQNFSDWAIMRNLTCGNKNECLAYGKVFLDILKESESVLYNQ